MRTNTRGHAIYAPPGSEEHDHQFARIVLDTFASRGLRTRDQIVGGGGPSYTYLASLRRCARGEGRLPLMQRYTFTKIDTAAGWRTGSAYLLWAHGDAPRRLDEDTGL